MIIQNQVKCLKCNDVIFSRHAHDYVACSCGGIAVDGGMSYLRRVGSAPFEDQSIHFSQSVMGLCRDFSWKDCDDRNFVEIANHVISVLNHHEYVTEITDEIIDKSVEAVKWADDTGRNDLGVVLAIIRVLNEHKAFVIKDFS